MPTLRQTGYCRACLQNVPHVWRPGRPLPWVFGWATQPLSRGLRLGPWHCIQCGNACFRLPWIRKNAPTFSFPEPERMPSGQSVGNVLQRDHSLVLRSKRASRYSEKYRDGMIQRILSGATTISQAGRELDVSEVDLVDWIADLVARKQDRIEELTLLLQIAMRPRQGLEAPFDPSETETENPPQTPPAPSR